MTTPHTRALRWAVPLLAVGLAGCLEYPDPAYGGYGGYDGPGDAASHPPAGAADATAPGRAVTPSYYGYRVAFDRWGRPMYFAGGTWRYVPPGAPGYAAYRRYWYRQHRARARRRQVLRAPATPRVPRPSPGQTYSDFDPAPGAPSPARRDSTVPPPAPGEPDRRYPRLPGEAQRTPTYRAPTYRAPTYRAPTHRPAPAPRSTWGTGRNYDASGRYRGRVDKDGRTYDSSGRYRGRTDQNGRSYDSSGRYRGRTDKDGRSYDASGRYRGRVDKDGRMYDASGRYRGRVDKDGRLYDASGRYQGRVSP